MVTTFKTLILGDIHGDRTLLLRALQGLGLSDAEGHWVGGSRRLVQLGDVLDRGPDPLACLELMMRLQQEALAAGGEVVCLLGNHEWMALRAAAGEHAARMSWTLNGAGAQYREWLGLEGLTGDDTEMPYPEPFFALFRGDQPYGAFLRSHQVAVRVGDYVVVHAGWTPDGPESVEEANRAFAEAPRESDGFLAAARRSPLASIHNLLWARNQPEAEIVQACEQLGCRGIIAGHSVMTGVKASFGGRLLQIDVGMYHRGRWAALGLDEAGNPWALLEGEEPVLVDRDGLLEWPAPAAERPGSGPQPAQHGPGALIRLYRAPDGSWAQYMVIRELTTWYDYPAYSGLFLVLTEEGWTTRPGVYPADRVDRFGRPAAPGEVPEHLLD